MGVLPPALAYNIQRIGLTSITLATGSYDSNVRDLVNSAILSATSATSGESATIVGDLISEFILFAVGLVLFPTVSPVL